MMSGSALSPSALASSPAQHTQYLAQQLKCPSEPEKNPALVECLRKKDVKELLSVNFQVPTFLTIFGPTVDKIVIPKDPVMLMSDDKSLFHSYYLMAGINDPELHHSLSENDLKNGLDLDQKEKVTRTLVRNIFDFHLQVK